MKVINPIQSDAFRRLSIRKTRNDSKDSLVIAQLMRFGEYSATRISEENIHALKQLSRYRLSLVEECGNCKRRVIALLDQVFPEYETLFSDTFGTTSKELLLNCPTPEDMLIISSRKLKTLLSQTSKGSFRDEKEDQIRKTASNSFGVTFSRDAFSFQIRQLIEQITFLEKQTEELE